MSFKEFLAEKEKEKLKNAEDRKQEVIAAREESKSSEQAWKEVQNELFMITHGVGARESTPGDASTSVARSCFF
jgi:hypothetical protein